MAIALFNVGTDGVATISASGATGLNTGFAAYGNEINRIAAFLPGGTAAAAATSAGTANALLLRDGSGGGAFGAGISATQALLTSTGNTDIPLVLRGAPTDPAMSLINAQNNGGTVTYFSLDNLGNTVQSNIAQAKQFYALMVGAGPGLKVTHSGDASNPPFLRFFASDGTTLLYQVDYQGGLHANTGLFGWTDVTKVGVVSAAPSGQTNSLFAGTVNNVLMFAVGADGSVAGGPLAATWTNVARAGLALNAPNGQTGSLINGAVNSVTVFGVAADGSLASGPLVATWTDTTKIGVTANAPNGQTGLLFNGKVNAISVFSVSPAGAVTGASFTGSGAGLTGLTGSQFAQGAIVFSKISDGSVSADGVSTTLAINPMKFFDAAGLPVNYAGGTYAIPSGQIGTLPNQNCWILVYITAAGTINSVASAFGITPSRPNKVQGTTPLMYVYSRTGMTAVMTADDSNPAHGYLDGGWRNPWDFGAPSGFLTLTQVATSQTSLAVTGMAGSSVDLAKFDASAITNGVVQHIDSNGHWYSSQAAVPTIAAGAGAGTTGTAVSVLAGSTDQKGYLSITTGSVAGTTGSTIATVTFRTAYGAAPHVTADPANAASQALTGTQRPFVDSASPTTTTFALTAGTVALPTSTTLIFVYHVL